MKSKYLKVKHYQYQQVVEIIDAGKSFDKALIVNDKVEFYNHGYHDGMTKNKHLFNIHIDDIEEFIDVIRRMKDGYNENLKGLANIFITHMWFPKYRGQILAHELNTIFIYYYTQAGTIFLSDRYSENDVRKNEFYSKLAFELGSSENIIMGVKEYKQKYLSRVRCIIDEKVLWLSRQSIDELKRLGE